MDKKLVLLCKECFDKVDKETSLTLSLYYKGICKDCGKEIDPNKEKYYYIWR